MPHILIIDDDDLLRTMLRLTLEEFGHTVTEARNGLEGLRLFQREPADLVITDLIMPEKEGIETIMELRKKYPGVKIIAMSGGGRVTAASHLRAARQLGANHVLTKPFDNDDLKLAIAATLDVQP
jgi:CheY-like chemotaxis protein